MSLPAVSNPRGRFFRSPHHAVLLLLTLVLGFAMGNGWALLVGAALYALGWIYLPDTPLFRNWAAKKDDAAAQLATSAEAKEFIRRRENMIAGLLPRLKEDYFELARVCTDIEQASKEDQLSGESRARKLDELMWMYLRLLTTEQTLVTFLDAENEEPLAERQAEAEQEVAELTAQVAELRAAGKNADTKDRLLTSKQERLETLRKRVARVEEAQSNLDLVRAEQERLTEQIKLIRAEAMATQNSEGISARISASVAHLNETNRWLSEIDQIRSLAPEPALPEGRVGYANWTPPPIPGSLADQKRKATRQRQ